MEDPKATNDQIKHASQFLDMSRRTWAKFLRQLSESDMSEYERQTNLVVLNELDRCYLGQSLPLFTYWVYKAQRCLKAETSRLPMAEPEPSKTSLPVLDITAMRTVLHKENWKLGAFWSEADRQLGIWKDSMAHAKILAPPLVRASLAKIVAAAKVDDMEALEKEVRSATEQAISNARVMDSMATRPPSPEPCYPRLLREQIDSFWTVASSESESRSNGRPWTVPLPPNLSWDTHLYIWTDHWAVEDYLGGLSLSYDDDAETVTLSLPEWRKFQRASPTPPYDVLNKFWYATHELWRWAETMRRAGRLIPFDVWIRRQQEEMHKTNKDKEAVLAFQREDTMRDSGAEDAAVSATQESLQGLELQSTPFFSCEPPDSPVSENS
ncbi:hypothetical protein B0T19DRAFT_444005 [Cercophora scortea]|uniref:Uncharacterized protein n=1 Tax=Cercophora scortea TaxID=314031 RepID=A0AAE0IH21_9PEZI|nr:hypothetical protein B0T19DRAFT_444005 [Cercophora scortea]